jgi:hypothetical protein
VRPQEERIPIGYKSPFIFLGDALRHIAASLETKGSPTRATGLAATEGFVLVAREDLDRARLLLEQAETRAKQNPSFKPMAEAAGRVVDRAKRRLDSALQRKEKSVHEPSQLGSHDEAWRQLCQASRDGAIKALSDEGDVPPAAFFNPGSPQDCRLRDEIRTPSRCYHHVKYPDVEIARFWPMPPPASNDCPEHTVKWMLDHAKSEDKLGRRVKKEPAIRACMADTGATWRQAEKAYHELQTEYKNLPRVRVASRL